MQEVSGGGNKTAASWEAAVRKREKVKELSMQGTAREGKGRGRLFGESGDPPGIELHAKKEGKSRTVGGRASTGEREEEG